MTANNLRFQPTRSRNGARIFVVALASVFGSLAAHAQMGSVTQVPNRAVELVRSVLNQPKYSAPEFSHFEKKAIRCALLTVMKKKENSCVKLNSSVIDHPETWTTRQTRYLSHRQELTRLSYRPVLDCSPESKDARCEYLNWSQLIQLGKRKSGGVQSGVYLTLEQRSAYDAGESKKIASPYILTWDMHSDLCSKYAKRSPALQVYEGCMNSADSSLKALLGKLAERSESSLLEEFIRGEPEVAASSNEAPTAVPSVTLNMSEPAEN